MTAASIDPAVWTGWFASTDEAVKALDEVYALAGRSNFYGAPAPPI